MYGIENMPADISDDDLGIVWSHEGYLIEYDSQEVETLKVLSENGPMTINVGTTYRRNGKIVHRDWPSIGQLVQSLRDRGLVDG